MIKTASACCLNGIEPLHSKKPWERAKKMSRAQTEWLNVLAGVRIVLCVSETRFIYQSWSIQGEPKEVPWSAHTEHAVKQFGHVEFGLIPLCYAMFESQRCLCLYAGSGNSKRFPFLRSGPFFKKEFIFSEGIFGCFYGEKGRWNHQTFEEGRSLFLRFPP